MIIWLGTFGLWAGIGLLTGAFTGPSYEDCVNQLDEDKLTQECADLLDRADDPPMTWGG